MHYAFYNLNNFTRLKYNYNQFTESMFGVYSIGRMLFLIVIMYSHMFL